MTGWTGRGCERVGCEHVVGVGGEYLWSNTGATLYFNENEMITTIGERNYGGVIPDELRKDRTLPDENGNMKTIIGLDNYRYACGDFIQNTTDAFIILDKSSETVWTWGYKHIEDAMNEDNNHYPGHVITGIKSVFGFSTIPDIVDSSQSHYFIAKETYPQFVTCNLSKPFCEPIVYAYSNNHDFNAGSNYNEPIVNGLRQSGGIHIYIFSHYLFQKFKHPSLCFALKVLCLLKHQKL